MMDYLDSHILNRLSVSPATPPQLFGDATQGQRERILASLHGLVHKGLVSREEKRGSEWYTYQLTEAGELQTKRLTQC